MAPETFEQQLVAEIIEINRYAGSEAFPEQLMRGLARLMQAERAIVLLGDGARLSDGGRNFGLQFCSHHPDDLEISRSVIENAMNSEKGYSVLNESVNPTASMSARKIRSCVAAVVRRGKKTLGALYCDIRKAKKEFGAQDGRQLKVIAEVFAPMLAELETAGLARPLDPAGERAGGRSTSIAEWKDWIGVSAFAREMKDSIRKLAPVTHPVLIEGPTGSGKDLIAQLLHSVSKRKGRFIAVNCAEVPDELLASELFGHVRGSYTGATVNRTGLIVEADGGTLFLDEIGNASLDFQAKLLRVIETKEVRPLGANVSSGRINVRFVFATNRNLKEMVAEKSFLNDLLFRISQIRLAAVPLSARKEDIQPLASHFVLPRSFAPDAIDYLVQRDWPGNVRQLKGVVEVARDLSPGDEITEQDLVNLSRYSAEPVTTGSLHAGTLSFYDLKSALESGRCSLKEAKDLLHSLFAAEGKNWAAVGRKLGMRTPQESRRFDNFIQYLRRKGGLD